MELPEIKISYKGGRSSSHRVTNAQETHEVLREIFDADTLQWKEESILLCLNSAHRLLGYYKISSGGMSGTVMDPRIIYTVALSAGATAIIVSHNHPSGSLKPSTADQEITNKLKDAGKLLDIKFLDHIIVTQESFFSFAENNLL
jgi:DNA repair protein RadC